jgi:hypothetical protein
MVLLGLITVVLLILCFFQRKNIKILFQQIQLNIPSHPSLPVIGHFHKFFRLSSEGKRSTHSGVFVIIYSLLLEAFAVTNEFSSSFPEVSKLWQFHHLNICVNSLETIEKVLMSKICLQRPLLLLKFFDVNEGLLSSRCK